MTQRFKGERSARLESRLASRQPADNFDDFYGKVTKGRLLPRNIRMVPYARLKQFLTSVEDLVEEARDLRDIDWGNVLEGSPGFNYAGVPGSMVEPEYVDDVSFEIEFRDERQTSYFLHVTPSSASITLVDGTEVPLDDVTYDDVTSRTFDPEVYGSDVSNGLVPLRMDGALDQLYDPEESFGSSQPVSSRMREYDSFSERGTVDVGIVDGRLVELRDDRVALDAYRTDDAGNLIGSDLPTGFESGRMMESVLDSMEDLEEARGQRFYE